MKDRKIEELPKWEQEAARQIVTVMQALMPWPPVAVITMVVERIEESAKIKKENEIFPF